VRINIYKLHTAIQNSTISSMPSTTTPGQYCPWYWRQRTSDGGTVISGPG